MEWINTITELKLVSNSCNKKLFYLFQVHVEISSSAKKFNFNKIKVICGITIFQHRNVVSELKTNIIHLQTYLTLNSYPAVNRIFRIKKKLKSMYSNLTIKTREFSEAYTGLP